MPRINVITCGTSILRNAVKTSEEDIELLHRTANKREEHAPAEERTLLAIGPDELRGLHAIEQKVREQLIGSGDDRACELSAELNGLIKYYRREQIDQIRQDIFYFIHTDTCQGEIAAKLLEEWCKERGISNISMYKVRDLNTADTEEFHLGINELVKWCHDHLPRRRNEHDKVIFNLVGGFKALQGYMQTLGMFYADEIVYIFEGSDKLLTIPRIPVDFDVSAKKAVEEHIDAFRKMSSGISLPHEECIGIPETLLFITGNRCLLSNWGELIWGEMKDGIYSKELLAPISELIVYTDNFRSDVQKKAVGSNKVGEVNQQIDKLSRYLDGGRKDDLQSCDYRAIKPHNGSDHEFDLWHDGKAMRALCHEKNGQVILDSICHLAL